MHQRSIEAKAGAAPAAPPSSRQRREEEIDIDPPTINTKRGGHRTPRKNKKKTADVASWQGVETTPTGHEATATENHFISYP